MNPIVSIKEFFAKREIKSHLKRDFDNVRLIGAIAHKPKKITEDGVLHSEAYSVEFEGTEKEARVEVRGGISYAPSMQCFLSGYSPVKPQ